MKKKLTGFYFCVCISAVILTGCRDVQEVWKPVGEDNTIRLALTGDEEFYTESGNLEAMELAATDFYERTGISVEIVPYDDEADYHKAIACANEIVQDTGIAAVLVEQELDYIDTIADIYEEGKKPFVITTGCYNHTIDQGYRYLLADFINAGSAGEIMGRYVMEQGFRRVAFCHSDTEYEEDELKGLQESITGSATILADTVVGPYTREEFEIAYSRWEALGIDVVCVSNYYSLNSDLVRMLRQKGSELQVVSDYVMDTDEDIETNGEYMEGTVIVPSYLCGTSEKGEQVEQRFKEKYGMVMPERAAQSYDLVMMLAEGLVSGIEDTSGLMDYLKREEGYEGIHGRVLFDEKGALIPRGDEVLVFSDGSFRSRR